MSEGVDYSSMHPSPQGLVAAGKQFVIRYGGPGGTWKHITSTEAKELLSVGLALVANAEGTADGLLQGWNAGVNWASSALAHFSRLGMPSTRPIYLSVDFDCSASQWPLVAAALRGAASIIGLGRVGVYGSYDVMHWAKRDNVARWYWQTYAWSGGRWAAHNHIEQYKNHVSLAGGTVDLCRSKVADFGQWGVVDVEARDVWAEPIGSASVGITEPAAEWLKHARLGHQTTFRQLQELQANILELMARPVAGVPTDEQIATMTAQVVDALTTALDKELTETDLSRIGTTVQIALTTVLREGVGPE